MCRRVRARSAWLWCAVAAVTAVAVAAGPVSRPARAAAPRPFPPRSDVSLTIRGLASGRALPAGFLGLSFEYGFVESYAGRNPHAVNPVLVRLMRNLAPGPGAVLRIGGDSSDWTWWPVHGLSRPPGVSYSLSPRWLAVVHSLALAADVRLILGINLEAGSPRIARGEARALIRGLGRRLIAALEIGNEPEQYATRWYADAGGRPVPGRPAGYDYRAYSHELARMRRVLPAVPLAAPATGALSWLVHLPSVFSALPALSQVTFHRYPLNRCVTNPSSPQYPRLAKLLSPSASRGLMDGVGRYVAMAHRRGAGFRVDELNSVTCQGKAGLSDTFASALWALDTLFTMARSGVDAVNFHVWPGAGPNQLFTFDRLGGAWAGSVRPVYYGILMFARAAPPGSRLLRLSGAGRGPIRSWATLGADGRIRITLINDGLARARTVFLRSPVRGGSAVLERLLAPSAEATGGVSIAGQRFGAQTRTGALAGTPATSPLRPSGGGYRVRVPAASAALVTIYGH